MGQDFGCDPPVARGELLAQRLALARHAGVAREVAGAAARVAVVSCGERADGCAVLELRVAEGAEVLDAAAVGACDGGGVLFATPRGARNGDHALAHARIAPAATKKMARRRRSNASQSPEFFSGLE